MQQQIKAVIVSNLIPFLLPQVFSAPNYCDTMGNQGAFITLIGGSDFEPKYTTYEAVEHPNVKPMAYANSLLSLFS